MKAVADRLLENLNPAQRCSVIFSALSREDFEEASRLADTAPTGIYKAGDFYNQFTRAMMVASLARGDIEQQTAEEWANRCFWVTQLHRGQDEAVMEAFWNAAICHQSRAGSLWAAYAQAVTDAGMNPGEVMQSIGGLSKLAQGSLDDGTEVEPCPDAVTLYTKMLQP